MKYVGGAWQAVGEAGFSAGPMQSPSLALDTSGDPYVAYMDEANSRMATVMKLKK